MQNALPSFRFSLFDPKATAAHHGPEYLFCLDATMWMLK